MKRPLPLLIALIAALMVTGCHKAHHLTDGGGSAGGPPANSPPTDPVFFVYQDGGSTENHYVPSGWFGDHDDLSMDLGAPSDAGTAAKITYSAKRAQGDGWAGVYWQDPPNNWGDQAGGFDLSAYTKLSFRARGDQGGEKIDVFGMGGITRQVEFSDSGTRTIGPITLSDQWETYEIDISSIDRSHIIGGFLVRFTADDNPSGLTIYLDDIRYRQ